MSKIARALALVAVVAAMYLAAMTAIAQATDEPDGATAHGRLLLAEPRSSLLNLPSGAPTQADPAAAVHQHGTSTTSTGGDGNGLAAQLATGRLATAKYATNLRAAKADGYQILTRMLPDMGWHFLNPTIQGFDITKPPILVYERHRHAWQLAAFEWVFPQTPATPPLPGTTYGAFGAACHYHDGTFVFRAAQERCPATSPQTGAAFNFWHPDLVTLHVWLWYPNPDGLYNGTNPLIQPFNHT